MEHIENRLLLEDGVPTLKLTALPHEVLAIGHQRLPPVEICILE